MRCNKLVRDNIVDMLEKKGKRVAFHVAKRSEYKISLRNKLTEEVTEYIKDGSPEELVDILEVVYAISEMEGISKKKLESLRKEKESDRGAFDKRIILEKVDD